MVNKYKRKPGVVQAVQWQGSNFKEIGSFVKTSVKEDEFLPQLRLRTPSGIVIVHQTDYIVRHNDRDYSPVLAKTFHKLYEKI